MLCKMGDNATYILCKYTIYNIYGKCILNYFTVLIDKLMPEGRNNSYWDMYLFCWGVFLFFYNRFGFFGGFFYFILYYIILFSIIFILLI